MIRYAVYNKSDGEITKVCTASTAEQMNADANEAQGVISVPADMTVSDVSHRIVDGEFVENT